MMTYIKIDRRVAIDTIIAGLSHRLREIQATEDELVYTVTEVLQGALKVTDTWDCVNATKYLKVLRKADLEAQEAVVERYEEKPCNKGCCKFEIKDGEKLNSFKALESRYAPNWDAPNAICGVVVDSPLMEVSKTIYKQVKEDIDDDVTDIA